MELNIVIYLKIPRPKTLEQTTNLKKDRATDIFMLVCEIGGFVG
jgi:hypothetical protein